MALSLTTIATTRRLTRLERVKQDLDITASTYDALLLRLIDEATAAIEAFCNRPYGFARQVYSETLPGFGDVHLGLACAPLVAVSSVTYNSTDTITDYSIADRDHALLYRRVGWAWTAQVDAGFTGRQRWPGFGNPLPRSEEPLYTVAYTAGYLLPELDLLAKTTISAASSDNSINDSASGFPSLLKAGDVVEVTGFATAANNGRFLVTGTPTAAKVVLSATLTTEAAGRVITVNFRNRPDARETANLEKACIEAVKTWYARRKDDLDVIEKQAGPMRLRYAEQNRSDSLMGLPAVCVGLLRPWIWRRAA